jgi:hypothetical protein
MAQRIIFRWTKTEKRLRSFHLHSELILKAEENICGSKEKQLSEITEHLRKN